MSENLLREKYAEQQATLTAIREEAAKRGINLDSAAGNEVYKPAVTVLDDCIGRLRDGKGEILFDCGLDGFELGPEKITIIGAPPGTGKTALASQLTMTAVENHVDQRLVIANAEMTPSVLLGRELSRRADVSYKRIRFASMTPDQLKRVETAAEQLRPLMERATILDGHCNISNLDLLCDMPPGIVVVDFIQKFRPVEHDMQTGLSLVLDCLRNVAKAGWCVLALSSTSRSDGGKNGRRHDTSKLDMGCFKGSGDIEFNADAAYVLRGNSDDENQPLRELSLDCVKNRHGAKNKFVLQFDATTMTFTTAPKHLDFAAWSGSASEDRGGFPL